MKDSQTKQIPSRSSSVVGIVFSEGRRKVLLIKRRDVPVWVLPGGGVDKGETPEEAVVREIQEETGLNASIKRPVGFYTPISNLANDTYTFECEVTSGSLTTGSETKEVGFFQLHNLPSPFFFLHQTWMLDALKNLPQVIQRPLTEVTYFNVLKYFLRHPIQVLRITLSRYFVPYNSK